MMTSRIHLGYEVPSGEPVSLPMRHMVVTGLTQQSGKTTTCEAIVSRLPEDFKALVFRTKRGDLAFQGAHLVPPFYRQESGWEYVLSVLEAATKQKLRLERSFIINASRGTSTLRQVYENIVRSKAQARRGFDESVLTVLEAYFEKVLPQIEAGGFAETLELSPGPNVMDLERFSEEVQALIISSCLEELWKQAENTFVIIPEAWAFIPQSRGNPVKWAAQHVIRQGAGVGVYLVLDSQDITGIDKALLKSVDCWLLGRQRELNEVKRVLDQLPPSSRPKAEEVTQLGIGQFFVAAEDWCKRVYVQPAWMAADAAQMIAMGQGVVPSVAQLAAAQGVGPATAETLRQMAKVGQDIPGELPAGEIPFLDARGPLLDETAEWMQIAQSAKAQTQQALEKLQTAEGERNRALELVAKLESQLSYTCGQLQEQREENSKLGASLRPLQTLRDAILDVLPPTERGAASPAAEKLDYDRLADLVAQRIGQARATVVTPLEALRHRYQEEAVFRLRKDIEELNLQRRRILEWLLAVGGWHPMNKICQGLGIPPGGSSSRAGFTVDALVKDGWMAKGSNGLKATVREKVAEALAPYTSDEEEIELVHNHLVERLTKQEQQQA